MGVAEREIRQELAERGELGPEYFQKDEEMVGVAEGSLRLMDNVPRIDISLLTSPSPATAAAEAQKLGAALSAYGFCFLINHGMTTEFLDGLRNIMKEFFQLPLEEKRKWKPDPSAVDDHIPEGYSVHENPQGDDRGSQQEWRDRFGMILFPECQSKLRHCPDNPPNFRKIMMECSSKVEKLLESVLKGMARSLGLEEESLVEEMGEGRIAVQFNHYPKCSRPDRVLGVNSHVDGSALTFLVQDKQVEGLQMLLKDGEWVRVPVEPVDALVLNVADQGEIMSNGEFKGPWHRTTVNAERERNTVALFCAPQQGKTIGPAKGLVSESRPAKYKEITNYEEEFHKQAYYGAALESLKL